MVVPHYETLLTFLVRKKIKEYAMLEGYFHFLSPISKREGSGDCVVGNLLLGYCDIVIFDPDEVTSDFYSGKMKI